MRKALIAVIVASALFAVGAFAASFTLISEDVQLPEPIPETRDLGWMLHDLDFGEKDPVPCFFRAALEKGRMMVPPFNGEGVRA